MKKKTAILGNAGARAKSRRHVLGGILKRSEEVIRVTQDIRSGGDDPGKYFLDDATAKRMVNLFYTRRGLAPKYSEVTAA